MKMIKGIDLSYANKNVDYNKLKQDGIEFAIIRTGYGKDENQKDALFETHYAGLKQAGIKVGAYLYSYCTSVENAEKEAENCLKHIAGKQFDLPIYLDLEEARTKVLGIDAVTQIALIFCRKIRNAGYRAGVYANLDWFKNCMRPDALLLENFSIWLAQWNDKITANFPVDIWQYTNNYDNKHIDGNYLVDNYLITSEDKHFEIKINYSLAVSVIFGEYGNGEERRQKLGSNYNEVQKIVNKIYEIIGDK